VLYSSYRLIKAVGSANKKTTTLGQALAWSIVGLLLSSLYHYLTGTSRQILLFTCGIMFVVSILYFPFAFYAWGADDAKTDGADEATETRHPVKKRLSLAFWAIGFGGAVLFTCFWFFGSIFFAHSRRAAFGALLPTVFGLLLAREALKMFREEKKAR
jgi:hypothetical protein